MDGKAMDKKAYIIVVVALTLAVISIGGIWIWEKNELKKIAEREKQVQDENMGKLEEEKIAQEENIDTSDWKTYRDEEYGFEIKYPRVWEIKKTRGPAIGGDFLQVIVDKNRNDIGMSVNRFKLNKDPKKWFKEEGMGGITMEKQLYINNYPTYYTEENNDKVHFVHNYLISNNGKIIWFSFQEKYRNWNTKTGKNTEISFSQYLPDFEAMVNSIKFID